MPREPLLVDESSGEKPLFGLVFDARVGEATLRGVDLVELTDADEISSFIVAVRPVGALMALGARMSGSQQV